MLLNWQIYKSDIENSGAEVEWKGLCYHLPCSHVSSAVVVYPGSSYHFHVRFECFLDGTAALVTSKDAVDLTEVFYNHLKQNDLHRLQYRRLLQYCVFMLMAILLIVFFRAVSLAQDASSLYYYISAGCFVLMIFLSFQASRLRKNIL